MMMMLVKKLHKDTMCSRMLLKVAFTYTALKQNKLWAVYLN